MRTPKILLLLSLWTLLAALSVHAEPFTLYVAIDGNDAWSGRLAAPNADGTDGPLATLHQARDRARFVIRRQMPEKGAVIVVRAGTYYLDETLQLSAEDSGSAAGPVVYRAMEGEKPVLVGGKPVGQFQPHEGAVLRADLAARGLAGAKFRQLYFAGRRQHLARYPNFDPQNPYGGGWAYADGEYVPMYQDIPGEDRHSLHYKPADARTWAHPEEGEVFVFPRYNWWNNVVPIKAADPAGRLVTLAGDCSYPIRPSDRYYVRGLREELDAPGEWYLDQATSTLYFWPPEPLEGRSVIVPTLRTIVEIGPGAHHITLRGFTIECCEGTAVNLRDASDCLIAACVVRNVGDYHGSGVSISGGQRCGVAGCDIYEVGHSGVSILGGDRVTLTPAEHYADNNYIHHVGVEYKQGVGVSLSGCGNRAAHNLIHDGPRWGIGFGGNNLVIEYNHIRHVNLETADTGAVYTGGRDWISSRGTVIRYNYFHDLIGFGWEDGRWVSPHYCWGVYLDDNCGGVDVVGNILARSIRGLVHLHNGRDNLIENNILIDGTLQQVEYNGWTKESGMWKDHLPTMIEGYERVRYQPAWRGMRGMDIHPTQAVLPSGLIMSGNVFRRNIVCYHDPKAKLFQFRNLPLDRYESDRNLIWHFGLPILTGQQAIGKTLSANLLSNPSFEEGGVGEMPAQWEWQERPGGKGLAVADAGGPAGGSRSLRMEGATANDDKGNPHYPIVVSRELPARLGQLYRLTARMRADRQGAKAILAGQSYVSGAYFWWKMAAITVGPEWKDCELVFRMPAEGDADYHLAMKALRVRIDFQQDSGKLWIDDVALHEVEAMDEWSAWQAAGFDRNSLVADPLFVDPEHGDYRLRPESPAFRLGFQPIPVEQIGPQPSPLRASWPIVEAEGAREKPTRLGEGQR